MIVGFARYSSSDAFAVLREERTLFRWMAAGSILGAGIGGLMLGVIPSHLLISILSLILLVSALERLQCVGSSTSQLLSLPESG